MIKIFNILALYTQKINKKKDVKDMAEFIIKKHLK